MSGRRVGHLIPAVVLSVSAAAYAQPAPPVLAPPPLPPGAVPAPIEPPTPSSPPSTAPAPPPVSPPGTSPDEQPGYDPLAGLPPPPPASPEPVSPTGRPFGRSLSFLARVGVEFGGDTLATVDVSDGSTQTISAGGRTVISAGVIYQPGTWALEATIGYKRDSSDISNGTVGFTRYPLDIIASIAPGGARVGAGIAVHFSPNYRCDITAICSDEIAFDTAVGAVVQLAYSLRLSYTTALDFAARYTFIKYSADGYNSPDGSGIGLLFAVRL